MYNSQKNKILYEVHNKKTRGNAIVICGALICLMSVAFFVFLSVMFNEVSSENEGAVYIGMLLSFILLLFGGTYVIQGIALNQAYLIVYDGGIVGNSVINNGIISRCAFFDVAFSEVTGLPVNENVAIYCGTTKYVVPVSKIVAQEIRQVIQENM